MPCGFEVLATPGPRGTPLPYPFDGSFGARNEMRRRRRRAFENRAHVFGKRLEIELRHRWKPECRHTAGNRTKSTQQFVFPLRARVRQQHEIGLSLTDGLHCNRVRIGADELMTFQRTRETRERRGVAASWIDREDEAHRVTTYLI